jgi:phosphoglycerol transferase MdoB-like AlkP superfamily enzyme
MNLSFKNYYFRWLKSLCWLFIIFVVLLTVARCGFALLFGDIATLKQNLPDVQKAFFLGLRYDLMPLAYVNLIPFLLLNMAYFIPGRGIIKSVRTALITILCLGYLTLIWIFVNDYGFYSYFQDHINVLYFGFFEDDTVAVVTSIWKNYNLPLWLGLIFLGHYVFYRFVKFMFSPYDFDYKAKKLDLKVPCIFFSGLIALAFMGRGNFTRLPLSIEDADISSDPFINKISINGALSLNRAIKIRKMFGKGDYDYLRGYGFADWKDAYTQLKGTVPASESLKAELTVTTVANTALEQKQPHVVLVVMESFGTYWNDQQNENFNILGDLKGHFDSGIYFKNFLSAENGTIGSIVSVATSQVIRPGARYLSESAFMNTRVSTGGHLPYKEKGYETHFVYGGKLGWRDLGKYLRVQGYDRLWGAEEITENMPELKHIQARDLGNEWGIFDEYLYTFLEEQLRTAQRPQFFLVLTTSNHPPFETPTSYVPLPLEIPESVLSKATVDSDLVKKRFLGLQYANHKMGQFLTRLRSSTIKDNVVVALTGDHSYWIAKGVGNTEEFKRYAVPFYLSLPDDMRPASFDKDRFGSHEDIFPTLYHLTLSNQSYVKLGEDMLGEESHALNSSGLVASKLGAYHNGQFWKWENLDKQILALNAETPELSKLKRHAESLISVNDVLLKSEKTERPPAEGNGPR